MIFNNHSNKSLAIALTLFVMFITPGCFTVNYSLSGASIHPSIKNASVQYFQNRAPIVTPGLSQQVTDLLKDKILSDTDLQVTNGYGDVDFNGEIVTFNTRPLAIQSDNNVAQNRFTIGIKVSFTNMVEPENDFESSFSRYRDYSSSMSFQDAQSTYSEEILDELIEDIFNKAFVNW